MKKKSAPQMKYDSQNTTRVALKLNLNIDRDIIDYLNNSGNKQGTIKQALREKMARE